VPGAAIFFSHATRFRFLLRNAPSDSFVSCGSCEPFTKATDGLRWLWSLEFHEWRGSDGPQYGNVATLEAAKQAFRAAWDRRPKAR
jgi:hypothetical protein